MPELPDVEVMRRYFDATGLHQQIETLDVHDKALLKDVSTQHLEKTIPQHTFCETRRHGKYLMIAMDNHQNWLSLHFGMTGDLQYFKHAARQPTHVSLQITYENGYHMAYSCPRRLGRIELVPSPDKLIHQHELGPDALSESLDLAHFQKLLGHRSGTIKGFLMDQSTLAGLGNLYSDEILYQARIHPRSSPRSLTTRQAKRIYHMMHKVLNQAIDHKADVDNLPNRFLLKHRQGDRLCWRCGSSFEQARIGGRTAIFCPLCQKP